MPDSHWNNEEQVFVAEVPKSPGCMAHGDDRDSALREVKDAMQFWIDRARDLGATRPGARGRAPDTRLNSFHAMSP